MRRLARLVIHKTRRAARRPKPAFCPRIIIFDFDGTIGDTFEAGWEILNQLAGEFGFRVLSREDLPKARDMRTSQLLAFLEVPSTKIHRISSRGTEELKKRIHQIQPLPGTADIIRTLHSRGYTLGIITSNTAENVRIFLKNHGLEHFDFIRSSSKLFGKAREIRAAMKELAAAPHEVLFVGDETRDIEACKKAGIRIAAVSWGYNSQSALTALDPDFLFHLPDELLSLLPEVKTPSAGAPKV